MLINVLFGLIFLGLLGYLAFQIYSGSKTPGRIAAEELEQERRRKKRRAENLQEIREQVDYRSERLAQAVDEVVRALGEGSGVYMERDDRTVRVVAGEAEFTAVFRLPEYDLDARNLDVEKYAKDYGKYVLQADSEEYRFDSLDEAVRFLARELARLAG
jgi:hypothetical protein